MSSCNIDNFNNQFIEIFTKRLKVLRYAHRLSLNNMALLLDFKSSKSVMHLESGKQEPSLETVLRISNLFAVNIDWIFGRSQIIYHEPTVTALEEEFSTIPFIYTLDPLKPILTFLDECPKNYRNIDDRKRYYTIEERANLVFLMQYYLSLTTRNPEVVRNHINQDCSSILKNFKQKLLDTSYTPRYKNPQEEHSYLLKAMGVILLNDLRNQAFNPNPDKRLGIDTKTVFSPIFDIKNTTVE
ncbi:MAG: helix-turn-helix transcriptional regulator [Phascolarctobacterium sp.]|nr:helix-turn-helix transcriptional regulator [Phascolarctobacterium sp.]